MSERVARTIAPPRLQVIVNGSAASYPERGRSFGTARIQGRREPDRSDDRGGRGKGRHVDDRFLRVGIRPSRQHPLLAGQIESIAATSVIFRLKGTPGERLHLRQEVTSGSSAVTLVTSG